MVIFIGGHAILLYFLWIKKSVTATLPTFCPIQTSFHIPCPMCGTSRAYVMLIQGKIVEPFLLQPMGVLLIISGWILTIWMIRDRILGFDYVFLFYQKIEKWTDHLYIKIGILLLIAMNWAWCLATHP